MRKVVVPNSFLAEAAQALKQGQTVKLHIDGRSMYPFIEGGIDLVEVEPCPPQGELPLWCCPFYYWEGRYMIHRYVAREGSECLMLGDGNLARMERVERSDILGVLRYIHRPNGTVQDCRDKRWLRRGEWWFRFRFMRRWLLHLFRLLHIKL
ncbi:S24/S26 family peptidase [Bacteroides sp. OttesenSCG-928-N06]|nr:S24/S26 family peptidase [Bacteroides sp. OttesenSCG-928-N06]